MEKTIKKDKGNFREKCAYCLKPAVALMRDLATFQLIPVCQEHRRRFLTT